MTRRKTTGDRPMKRAFSSRWFHAATVLVIAVSVLIAYSNTFHSTFQFDDMHNIVQNKSLRDLGDFLHVLKGNRGVTNVTFMLNYAAGGLDTFGYHVVNTVIHIINASLAYILLLFTFRALGSDELWSRRMAAFSALIFALHPVQTQAVTYIVQRMESFSSLFYLAGLIFFVTGARASSALRRWPLYACVCASYYLAFHAKEIGLTFPAVILLYDLCFLSWRGRHGRILSRWPLYAVLSLLMVLFVINTVVPMGGFSDLVEKDKTITVEQTQSEAPPGQRVKRYPTAGFGVKSISPKEYLYTQFNVLVYYVALLAVPVNQNVDYDFPVAKGLFETPHRYEGAVLNLPVTPPVVSLVILVFITALALYLLRRSRRTGGPRARIVSFFILWFFIILSPTSSFIPISDVIFEHRLYLPSLGYFVIFVICMDAIITRLFSERRSGEAATENT